MSDNESPYFVILDTNIWVTERLLQSSLGSAVLYAVAADGASIVLPEIVEMEVNKVLEQQAEKAVADFRKNADFLRQISGHQKVLHSLPTSKAISDGIARRWKELSGVLIRAPFTIEQARSSLIRILNHLPPSGENNEQFRDCCIWASAVELSESRVVHLVTRDNSFYSGRDFRQNMTGVLKKELEALGRTVRLYSSVGEFIEAVSHEKLEELEKKVICDEIVRSVTPLAQELAIGRVNKHAYTQYELGEAVRLEIKGYATPRPSLVAVEFEVSFNLRLFDKEDGERQVNTILTLDGSCSYDPSKQETSDVVVKSWVHRPKGKEGRFWSESMSGPALRDQFEQTRFV